MRLLSSCLALVLATAAGPATAQVIADVGLQGPEAARYDDQADVFVVTNLGGRGAANDGFISRVSPDGEVLQLKWIEAGRDGVVLRDPLGLVLHGDLIHVADAQAVRRFDRRTGAPRGEVQVEGAVRLNDIAAAPDGTLYVTDSGSDSAPGALYRITPDGQVHVFAARSPDLNRPNGIAVTPDGLIVHGGLLESRLTFRDAGGEVVRRMDLPTGRIDGIVALADGALLMASQDGHLVYRVTPDGRAHAVAEGLAVPAAIGLDTRRNRLIVPQIAAASLSLFDLPQE